MPRKISEKLMHELTKGKFKPLLDYVLSDSSLRLEVRRQGDAFIYYRKGKALELKNLKADAKYGQLPDGKLALSNPQKYFFETKKIIDNWVDCKKDRAEFDTQQNIATCNQLSTDRYVILDMEYQLEQNQLKQPDRIKRATFDLMGIDKQSNRVVLIEVKRGLGALSGSAGIDEHIKDFDTYFNGKHKALFVLLLKKDIENIVSNKKDLGLLDYEIEKGLNIDPEFVFVFEPVMASETIEFVSKLGNRKRYHVVTEGNYKLI